MDAFSFTSTNTSFLLYYALLIPLPPVDGADFLRRGLSCPQRYTQVIILLLIGMVDGNQAATRGRDQGDTAATFRDGGQLISCNRIFNSNISIFNAFTSISSFLIS